MSEAENITPLYPRPEMGSTWWGKADKHRSPIDAYYEVVLVTDRSVMLVVHHLQRRFPPVSIMHARLYQEYDARVPVPTFVSMETEATSFEPKKRRRRMPSEKVCVIEPASEETTHIHYTCKWGRARIEPCLGCPHLKPATPPSP